LFAVVLTCWAAQPGSGGRPALWGLVRPRACSRPTPDEACGVGSLRSRPPSLLARACVDERPPPHGFVSQHVNPTARLKPRSRFHAAIASAYQALKVATMT